MNSGVQISDLVARLRLRGVSLWEEDGKLKYKAPSGILSPDDLQRLKESKEAVIQWLRSEAGLAALVSDKDRRYEPFPLTDVQSAYLLGRSGAFAYGGVACHIYLELSYSELEYGRVQEAWNRLVARHDMLRAVIGGDGYQRVLKDVPPFRVAYADINGEEAEQAARRLEQIREEMGHRMYDTEIWPLFDVAVTRLPERCVLHLSIEFLIADWASIWRLLTEFEVLYFEKKAQLPQVELSFRDYVLAERGLRDSAAYVRDRNYWLDRLALLPSAPALPTAAGRRADGPVRFARHSLHLDAGRWGSLKRKARELGVTPTAAVLTAYAAVIERWSRYSAFCLNLTVLNRLPLHPQVHDIVGDFTSVNLLAVDWSGERSLRERALALNARLFEDLDHRLFSGIEVMRELSRRDGGGQALMPVVFTSAIGLAQPDGGLSLTGKAEGTGISQTPQVFIDCQAMDQESGLYVNWDVREGVFPDGLIDDMFAAFGELMHALSEGGAWKLSEAVPLPAPQAAARVRSNAAKRPLPVRLLHGSVLEQARLHPGRTAIVDGEGAMTYGQLVRAAGIIAAKLKRAGCRLQDRVAVLMETSAVQAAAALGVMLAGAVYVPVDPKQPERRRRAMMDRTGTLHIVTRGRADIGGAEDKVIIDTDALGICAQARETGAVLPRAESGGSVRFREDSPQADADIAAAETAASAWELAAVMPETAVLSGLTETGNPDLPAYIIHTSGSTGKPKGVVISHRAAVNTIEDINDRFGVGAEDKLLGLSRPGFDLAVYDLFGVLSAGGTLIYPSSDRRSDPSHWAELMTRHGITVWNTVPALLQMLLAYVRTVAVPGLDAWRLALLSGDWIPLALPGELLELAPSVKTVSLGGATEAAIWSIYHEYAGPRPDWSSIPYGKPLANQRFRVLDGKYRDCPDWVPGELFIAGAGLADGYDGDSAATAAAFVTHPHEGERLYRTGDLGRYRPGGEIEFLGREDHQVKIRGHRIELGEIEAALQRHPAVAACAAVVRGTGADKSLAAVVENRQGQSAAAAELAAFLAGFVPAYMIPSAFAFTDRLPLTGNGKVDRKRLLAWSFETAAMEAAAGAAAEAGAAQATSGGLEELLTGVWAEALGVNRLDSRQNFYEHGADSLIMAQVAGKLRDLFAGGAAGPDIPFDTLLRQMLNYPTVAELAAFIGSYGESAAAGGCPAATAEGLKAGRDLPMREEGAPLPAPGEPQDSASNAVLTPYGGGETGPLRVVFHAGLGTMNCFHLLLGHLEEQQLGPVIGITVADTERYCIQDHKGLIERLADDYAARLLETGQREFQLMGYCLGGLIAVETAGRLLEQGAAVLDLVLVDSHPVLYSIEDELAIETLFVPNLNISLEQAGFAGAASGDLVRGLQTVFEANGQSVPAGALLTIGGDAGLDQVGAHFRSLAQSTRGERFAGYVQAVSAYTGGVMPAEMAEGLFKVYRQSLKAADFIPRPYAGDIRFLLASEPFSLLPGTEETTLDYWRDCCLGQFTVAEIAGNHFTCIETEAGASALANIIADMPAAERRWAK